MKIETFFRHFLLTPVNHLPVVDEEKNLLGLLSKNKITREMADLSSEGDEYQQIPPHLMEKEINENVLYYFQNFRTIPVLNLYSQRVDAWEKPRFLAEVSKLLESGKQENIVEEEEEEERSSEPQSKLLIYKFMELILRNFPDALYATDKDGNTTFYNEKFETTVLSRNIFRDSITIAEKYFKEVSRDLISEYFKSTEDEDIANTNLPPLITYIRNLQLFIKLITLRADEKVIGYLYHFTDPKARSIVQKGVPSFPVLEEAFEMNLPLGEVLKDVESAYILKSFKKNQENISHTAGSLGLPRSTLQNRIKFLGLSDMVARDPDSPIPRTKRDQEDEDNESVLKITTPPIIVEKKSKSLLVNRIEGLNSEDKEKNTSPKEEEKPASKKRISKKKKPKIEKKRISKKKPIAKKKIKQEKKSKKEKPIEKSVNSKKKNRK